MKFCPDCDSMLQYTVEEDKLMLVCQICGYSELSKETLISNKDYRHLTQSSASHHNFIYDPTFARTIYYNCPNPQCPTRTDPMKKEAITFNVENSMRKGYICTACNSEWNY